MNETFVALKGVSIGGFVAHVEIIEVKRRMLNTCRGVDALQPERFVHRALNEVQKKPQGFRLDAVDVKLAGIARTSVLVPELISDDAVKDDFRWGHCFDCSPGLTTLVGS